MLFEAQPGPDSLRAKIDDLAYRLWSIHPAAIPEGPPREAFRNNGGRRANYYADQIDALVADLERENVGLRAEVERLKGLPPALSTTPSEEVGDEPGYDFWAIVALRHHGDDVEAYVMQASDDCRARDILINGDALSDNGDSLAWTAGRPAGVYRIRMSPTMHGDDDFDLAVSAVSPLFELDPGPARSSAEQVQDLKAALADQATALPGLQDRIVATLEAGSRYSGRKATITGIRYTVRFDPLTRGPLRQSPTKTLERHAFEVVARGADAERPRRKADTV